MIAIRLGPVAALLALMALFGNGPPAFAEESAAVSGQITLDGKPLAGGRIFFHQDDGQFVGAKIDKDLGKFKLTRVPVGKYKVTVDSKGVPGKFSAEGQAVLTVDVKAGDNVFDFSLTSK